MKGLNEFSPTEFEQKQAAIAGAPRSVLSVVKSHSDDTYQIIDAANQNQQIEFAYQMDAMNHLLALLNFPDKLRGFLDCLLGLAKFNDSQEFTATNFQLGIRSRSGRAACSDNSMEKWVTRQKEKINEWMSAKNFHFVNITLGDYDIELKRRKPTRYQVFFNQYVIETVQTAKSLWYWRDGSHYTRFQGRALREAARIVINRIPEAPPLKLAKVKIIPTEDLIDRRDHTITTLLEKQRDDLAALGIDHEEYFIKRERETNKIRSNPTGMVGKLITEPHDEPDRRGNIVKRILNGTLLLEQNEEIEYSDFNQSLQNFTGADVSDENPDEVLNTDENVNSLKINDETRGTFLSDQGDIFDDVKHFDDTNQTDLSVPDYENMDQKLILSVLKSWEHNIREKLPKPKPSDREKGCWEIEWASQTAEAVRTSDALNWTILKAERDRVTLDQVKSSFIEYVMARVERWENFSLVHLNNERVTVFRDRLSSFLTLPDSS